MGVRTVKIEMRGLTEEQVLEVEAWCKIRLDEMRMESWEGTPEEAFDRGMERGPSDATRAVACQDPELAGRYAQMVDGGPRDDTRRAACRDPEMAYLYALYVDRGYHPETWAAIRKTEYFWPYVRQKGIPEGVE